MGALRYAWLPNESNDFEVFCMISETYEELLVNWKFWDIN